MEKETLGLFLSCHPLKGCGRAAGQVDCALRMLDDPKDASGSPSAA